MHNMRVLLLYISNYILFIDLSDTLEFLGGATLY